MARIDNLNNFLTDVADSIREKKGATELIPASAFDTEIDSISSGVDINDYYVTVGSVSGGNISQYIKKIPLIDTSNVTSTSDMFRGCAKLISIPPLDTSKVVYMSSMFYDCVALKTIPPLDTSNVTTMNNMFTYCSALTTIPQLNLSKVTNVSQMVYPCYVLTTLGGFQNLGMAYSTTESANYRNYRLDLSTSSKLTHDSLMNVINGLYDIKTKGCNAQQLILGSVNLAKLTAEEIQIATDKGFSVS